jgi:hypothetical protein
VFIVYVTLDAVRSDTLDLLGVWIPYAVVMSLFSLISVLLYNVLQKSEVEKDESGCFDFMFDKEVQPKYRFHEETAPLPLQQQQQQQQQANENANATCIVCTENARNTVFVPCGHIACCTQCSESVMQHHSRRCPVCRARVDDAFKTFMA